MIINKSSLQKLIFSLSLPIFLCILPVPTYAHQLKTDGNIGAVLHIDPGDDPVVGQPATFFFEIKDKTDKFTPVECTCTVSIIKDNKTLDTESLFVVGANNVSSPQFTYIFPNKGVYTVSAVGKPIGNSFQPFVLSYDVRVEKEATSTNSNYLLANLSKLHLIHYLGLGVIVVFLIIFIMIDKRRQKRQNTTTGGKL